MAKINILDSNVYNRIAAGEVVERPASAVKEFVENSLDAGAKNIVIRIERGGKDLISVSDDGAGIEKSEMYSAFLPHATSKIEKAEDLDAITTLGFRGEALASIASVSRVTLRSKTAGEESAGELVCAGGKMGEILPCALSGGTEIVAENLFYNTPVRAKFMKTDKGEESEVSAVVSRFVLGNPEVAFKYYIDGKLSLQSFGGGLGGRGGLWGVGDCGMLSDRCGQTRDPAERVSRQTDLYQGKPYLSKRICERPLCRKQYHFFRNFQCVCQLSDEAPVSFLRTVRRRSAGNRGRQCSSE